MTGRPAAAARADAAVVARASETQPPGILPTTTLPHWLPAAFLVLLTLPLHPFWLDFEQVRRGLLLILVGTVLLWRPLLPALPRGLAWCGITLLSWSALSLLLHLGPGVFDGGSRLAYLLALGVVLALGRAAAASAALTAAASLVVVAALLGLLQRFDLPLLPDYGGMHDPVSLFGNLNVAAESTVVGVVAAMLLWPTRRWLAATALLLGGAYLIVNGTRAAYVALPFGIGWLGWQHRRNPRPALLAIAVLGLGLGAGLVLQAVAPTPPAPPVEAASQPFAANRAGASLPLRWEISVSALHMALDAPLLGTGPGRFQVEYPRYRSQQEIELSSYGRQFATEVRALHDDWLEMLVEGGLPALLLLLAIGWQLRRGGALAAPLVVLAVLMLARAPLGNAPAAAVALLLAGCGLGPVATQARLLPGSVWRGLGLAMLLLGLSPVLGNCLFVGYQAPRAHGGQGDLDALRRAIAVAAQEPAYHHLLAQELLLQQPPDLAGARDAIEAALRLRPYEPVYHLLHAEIVLQGNDLAAARQDALAVLQVDPGNPEARVLLSAIYFREGNHDAACRIVYEDPHPRLLAQLPQHFRDLERLAQQRGDTPGENRYAAERSLLTLLPLLGVQERAARARADLLGPTMLRNFAAAGLSKDVRPLAAAALLALDAGELFVAAQFGSTAAQLGCAFAPWQRRLFGAGLQRLQAVPTWRPLLQGD